MNGTGQQASNTVTHITHGSINADASATVTSANHDAKGERKIVSNSTCSSTTDATKKTVGSSNLPQGSINSTFDDAFTSLITTNNSEEQVKKSLRIMRKLISNVTAQDADDGKNKVRISITQIRFSFFK
jgi:hypothetical protein